MTLPLISAAFKVERLIIQVKKRKIAPDFFFISFLYPAIVLIKKRIIIMAIGERYLTEKVHNGRNLK